VHVPENEDFSSSRFQVRESMAELVVQFFFAPGHWRTSGDIQEPVVVALRGMAPARSDHVQSDIHGSSVEISPRIRRDLRWKLPPAETQEQCLDHILRIGKIARNAVCRPVHKVVVIPEQRLKFRGEQPCFQRFARCNRHEVLVWVTPGLSCLLHAAWKVTKKIGALEFLLQLPGPMLQ
jgi:hypothetical protein